MDRFLYDTSVIKEFMVSGISSELCLGEPGAKQNNLFFIDNISESTTIKFLGLGH